MALGRYPHELLNDLYEYVIKPKVTAKTLRSDLNALGIDPKGETIKN
jgi:hypothetical protein